MTVAWVPNVQASSDPIYLTIAKAIAADVASGRLKPGDRLPTHRELAGQLGLSLGTVTRGYVEAIRRGIIRGETGRGTFVRGPDSEPQTPFSCAGAAPELIDLSLNFPLYSEDPDLGAALARLARDDVSRLLRYESARTRPRYLQAGAAWLRTWGQAVDPQSLVITAGAQHALDVILTAVARPGDLILADELTYPGLIALAQLRDLRLQGITMDGEGMVPDALLAACRQRKAQLLYCMPTLQNPTSTVLSEQRRRMLADIAREHDLLIIEEGMLRPLVPDVPPALQELAPERTFCIASLSKVVAGGLRVAYVVAPPLMQEKLRHSVWATLWMPAPLSVEIATMWIEDGTAERTARRKRREIEARQGIAREILKDLAPPGHRAAYSIWIPLPAGWTCAEFAAESVRRGVAVSTACSFAVPGVQAPEAVRISLGAAEDRLQLRAGLRIIAGMLHDRGRAHPAVL